MSQPVNELETLLDVAPPKEAPVGNLVPVEPKVEHKRSAQVDSAEKAAQILADSKERSRKAAAIGYPGKLVDAIASIIGEVGVVRKEGYNRFHNYKFVQYQDLSQAIAPLMSKYKVVIFQTQVNETRFDDGRVLKVDYEFTIAHPSGVWPDRPRKTGVSRCVDSKGNFDDKAWNKCATAARKYMLLEQFQIPTGDEEADAETTDRVPASKPAPNAALHDPRPEPPPHDPETGEIILSIEDTARAKAREGKSKVIAYWRACVAEDKKKIEAIQHEFPALYPLADN